MSPYRVLVTSESPSAVYSDGRNQLTEIYAAMLSTDRRTGKRRIYILYKPYPLGFDIRDAKTIAHKMNTKSNAQIVAEYTVEAVKAYQGRYRTIAIERQLSEDCHRYIECALPDLQYTLQDCLVYAMHEYLGRENLKIISEL